VQEGGRLLNLVLPKIECVASSRNYGRFIISPLERGFGTTIGNALRRVLLSSLPGAAVTSMRVSGVYHEFSPIPNVKEDMTELMLNVKKLRFRMYSDEQARLRLEARGEGVVTAADLECPSHVEVVNPDQYLLTVDSNDANFEMELTVERGKGYSPVEERGQLPIGELPVDAIFSPIRKVNFRVEPTRVGQMTNFDRLIMEIWTDGTIKPHDALSMAAQILVRHLTLIAGVTEAEEAEEEVPEEETFLAKIYDTPIEELDLSVRVYNCLKRTGITRVGEVLERLEKGESELLSIRNFGMKSLRELKDKLREKGFLPEELDAEAE